MSHVVLLGDSIFDNDRYVPGGPSVIEHLRKFLPAGLRATLLARDGAGTAELQRQLELLPDDATHLVVSVGGNDALDHSGLLLHEPAGSFAEVLSRLAEIQEQFRQDYRAMLQRVLNACRPTAVCTVYDSIPGLDPVEKAGLRCHPPRGIRSRRPTVGGLRSTSRHKVIRLSGHCLKPQGCQCSHALARNSSGQILRNGGAVTHFPGSVGPVSVELDTTGISPKHRG
jgi:hypothetical protein